MNVRNDNLVEELSYILDGGTVNLQEPLVLGAASIVEVASKCLGEHGLATPLGRNKHDVGYKVGRSVPVDKESELSLRFSLSNDFWE